MYYYYNNYEFSIFQPVSIRLCFLWAKLFLSSLSRVNKKFEVDVSEPIVLFCCAIVGGENI